jgi:hypothetical protein
MASEETMTSPPPAAALGQLIWGFTVSQALYTAAKLGIADVLRNGPKSPSEIADAVGADELALHRLCRALTTINILTEDAQGGFATTAMGELLSSDHPQSMRPMAILMGSPFVWRPWGELSEAIVTGMPAFDQVYGETFFEYFGRRPEDASVFNEAMSGATSDQLPAILAAYDFSGFSKIADVGGGQGALLRGILEQYPNATGVLCDVPSVVAEASEIRGTSVADRCEYVGADIFQSVPLGADAYILKAIVHDWSDAQSIQILLNCRQAIRDDGKILLIELVIKPSNEPDFAKWLDLNMLVVLPGRERTEEEFRDLYAAAGFQLTRIIPTGGVSIIEGIPVQSI